MADLLGVELARPGEWDLESGPLTVTAEMLADAAEYAQLPGSRPAPVKLGHSDARFAGDGEPAMGWVSNIRVEGEGADTVLLGDITGMPDWLATAAPAHWPDRSIEGWQKFVANGKTYGLVIDGLALLGVTPPGMSTIRSLRDLPQALGVAASARIVARMGTQTTASAEEPTEKGAGRMDPALIREALGLAADVSDDEVKAALVTAGLANQPAPPTPNPQPDPTPTAPKPELVNAAGTRVVAESVWDEQQRIIRSLTEFVEETKRGERDQVIAQAVTAGKFTPAQKAHFSRLWDADPAGTRQLIDELTPNSALAVAAAGYDGDVDGKAWDREFAGLFGPNTYGGSRG